MVEVLLCDSMVLGHIPRSFCVPSYFMRKKILLAKLNFVVRIMMGVLHSSGLHISGCYHGFVKPLLTLDHMAILFLKDRKV